MKLSLIRLLLVCLLPVAFACPPIGGADCNLAELSADVTQENDNLVVKVELSFCQELRFYFREKLGLEELLGGYLEIEFEREKDGAIYRLHSGSFKSKYPHEKFVRTMSPGTSLEDRFEIAGEWPYAFLTPEGTRLSQLPPGTYRVRIRFEVPDNQISKRVSIDPLKTSWERKSMLVIPERDE